MGFRDCGAVYRKAASNQDKAFTHDFHAVISIPFTRYTE
jgi:hypothetical protein